MFNTFFREKPAMILVTLFCSTERIYASTLAKVIDCTYSHAIKLLQEMNKAGLVSFEKKGRLKLLTLTKIGEEVARSLDNVKNILTTPDSTP